MFNCLPQTFAVFLLVCVSPAEIVYTPSYMSQAEFHLKRILSFLQDAYAYINGQYKSGPVDEPAMKKVRKEDGGVCTVNS